MERDGALVTSPGRVPVLGVLVATALTGFLDWLTITRGTELWKTATAHMIAMLTATVCFGLAALTGHGDWKAGNVHGFPLVMTLPLDVADEKSTMDLAADIGGKVDILVNTTEYIRSGGLLDRRGTSVVRDEIDQAYLGFINLAQAFGPGMRMRGADGVNNSVAWVNVLSVYALVNWPAFGAYSASQAGCLSLSHSLRAELRPGGVKVINLFTGPIDIEWFQTVPPPKVAPRAVATAVVSALQNGLEEVYAGDVAEEIRQRLAANPKAVERELGGRYRS